MGEPSSARRPPCVLRMRNSGSSTRAGSQPMPAFCVSPNRLPEGALRSISAVMGSAPCGPRAWVATAYRLLPADSRTDWKVMAMDLPPAFRGGDGDERVGATIIEEPVAVEEHEALGEGGARRVLARFLVGQFGLQHGRVGLCDQMFRVGSIEEGFARGIGVRAHRRIATGLGVLAVVEHDDTFISEHRRRAGLREARIEMTRARPEQFDGVALRVLH